MRHFTEAIASNLFCNKANIGSTSIDDNGAGTSG